MYKIPLKVHLMASVYTQYLRKLIGYGLIITYLSACAATTGTTGSKASQSATTMPGMKMPPNTPQTQVANLNIKKIERNKGPRSVGYETNTSFLYLPSAQTALGLPIGLQYDIETLAVLLPVGASGVTGQVARNIVGGIKRAFENQENTRNFNVEKILVYDTANTPRNPSSAPELYQQAIQEGATFVIGPMMQDKLDALIDANTHFPVPTLSLAFSPFVSPKEGSQLYTFSGVSIENEAAATAERMFLERHRMPLVLHASQPWAKRQSEAFITHFFALSGHEPSTKIIEKRGMSQSISEALGVSNRDIDAYKNVQTHIRNTGAQLNAAQKKPSTPENLETIAELEYKIEMLRLKASEIGRSKSLDGVYLAVGAPMAQSARPLISYYLSNDLKVYAPSRTYGGRDSERRLLDLNFSASAWLTDYPPLYLPYHQSAYQSSRMIPENFQNMYALGVDAFSVIPYIFALSNYKNYNYSHSGILGTYLLRQDGRILRNPYFYHIESNGVVHSPALSPIEPKANPRNQIILQNSNDSHNRTIPEG